MKKVWGVILFWCVGMLMGCSSLMFVGAKHSKYDSTVEVIEYHAMAKVEYKSYRYLLSELAHKAHVQMWSSDTMKQRAADISAGGYVFVKVNGSTLASANTKYWEYIVMSMDGEVITRQQGRDQIPNHTTSEYGTNWWNYDVILINKKITGPFKVYVLDKLMNRRSGFIVYPGPPDR